MKRLPTWLKAASGLLTSAWLVWLIASMENDSAEIHTNLALFLTRNGVPVPDWANEVGIDVLITRVLLLFSTLACLALLYYFLPKNRGVDRNKYITKDLGNNKSTSSVVIANPKEYTVQKEAIDESGLTAQFRQTGLAVFSQNDKDLVMFYVNFYIRNSGVASKAMDFKFYIQCGEQKFYCDWFQPDTDMQLDANVLIRADKLLLTHTERFDVPETRIIEQGDSALGWIINYAPIKNIGPLYEMMKKEKNCILIVSFHDLNGVATIQWADVRNSIKKGIVDLVERGAIAVD